MRKTRDRAVGRDGVTRGGGRVSTARVVRSGTVRVETAGSYPSGGVTAPVDTERRPQAAVAFVVTRTPSG
jgi:hypothetical protein